ncbi:hypothetical protein [Variovorax sp. R-27]|uniref:hypothetical protein n=1 Tax=Variovorax sp. R-27 TaxID=3404058 RepID=UPI003CE95FC3
MPIDAQLSVPADGKTVERLRHCMGLRAALSEAKVSDGLLFVDVKGVLLLEDAYGRIQEQSTSDEVLWRTKGARPVLHEEDLGDPEKVGLIGRWNLDFLRWLHGVSAETSEPVEISYTHERGDTLYESAWWAADPSSAEGRIETFGIQNDEGMDETLWRAEAIRLSDGRLELR